MANNIVLSGNLSFLNLAELLQLLGSNGSNGILRINSKYAQEPGIVYFLNGNPVHSLNSELRGLEAIFSLFGWMEGAFTFNEEPYDGETTINKSRMEIILDGLRKLDDGEIEKVEPVSIEKESTPKKNTAKKSSLPLIKGPLVDYLHVVDEEEFFDGEEIIVEGNHGNWIWVILEGTVELSRSTPKGPLKFLQISDGAFIGSISSLLSDESVRNLTAQAVGNVQLGMLDSQGMGSEFSRMTPEFRNVVRSLDNRFSEIMNRAVACFIGKNDPAKLLKEKRPVITEGKNDDKSFIITGGRASIARKTKNGIIPLISGLSKGDFIGHISFLDMGLEPTSAIVLGDKRLKVSTIDQQSLQDEYDQLSLTFQNILENISTNILATAMVISELAKKAAK
ncbi:MAG: cyclic nucleotide-binding domain-containing protein [Nitrospinales bacterium]